MTSLTPQQRRELLKNANEEAQWLIRIVENLLSITRIGRVTTRKGQRRRRPPEEVIEGAVGKFRRRYPGIGYPGGGASSRRSSSWYPWTRC